MMKNTTLNQTRSRTDRIKQQSGLILITVVILLGGLVLTGAALLSMVDSNFEDSAMHRDEVKAFYLAESAAEEAIWYIKNVDYLWEGDSPVEHVTNNGSYTISIDRSTSPTFTITATGYVPNISHPNAIKIIRLTGTLL